LVVVVVVVVLVRYLIVGSERTHVWDYLELALHLQKGIGGWMYIGPSP